MPEVHASTIIHALIGLNTRAVLEGVNRGEIKRCANKANLGDLPGSEVFKPEQIRNCAHTHRHLFILLHTCQLADGGPS